MGTVPDWLIALFTAALFAATIVLVIVSWFQWRVTNDAVTVSRDTLLASMRPLIVDGMHESSDAAAQYWHPLAGSYGDRSLRHARYGMALETPYFIYSLPVLNSGKGVAVFRRATVRSVGDLFLDPIGIPYFSSRGLPSSERCLVSVAIRWAPTVERGLHTSTSSISADQLSTEVYMEVEYQNQAGTEDFVSVFELAREDLPAGQLRVRGIEVHRRGDADPLLAERFPATPSDET